MSPSYKWAFAATVQISAPTFLVWHAVRQLEQVDVANRHSHVLSLTARKATREVRVAKNSSCVAAVHAVLELIRVGILALRGKFPVAVHALAEDDNESVGSLVFG